MATAPQQGVAVIGRNGNDVPAISLNVPGVDAGVKWKIENNTA
jgi:hypothetical protein